MAQSLALNLPDVPATAALGAALARAVQATAPVAATLYLDGELGAGKTTLTRALLAGLGHPGRVPSPTYTLVEPYTVSGYRVLHVDLYRLADPAEVDYLGLQEELGPGSLLIVEWPHRADGRLPAADLELLLVLEGEGRRAQFQALSPVGQALLDRLIAEGC